MYFNTIFLSNHKTTVNWLQNIRRSTKTMQFTLTAYYITTIISCINKVHMFNYSLYHLYFLRERPTGNARGIMEDLPNTEQEGALLGLPETQTELDVSKIKGLKYIEGTK